MMNRTSRRRLVVFSLAVLALVATGIIVAQDDRPKSPEATASTQIGDAWIDVHYSAPILRGRADIFGAGEEYGKAVTGSAPLWRAGANVTTRIHTQANLEIGGTSVPAGEYSLFIDLKEGAWTAVISKQAYMESFSREKVSEGQTWGSYGYSADHDVARAEMYVSEPGMSVDQMTYFFNNVTEEGGELGLIWGNQMAMLPFKVAK
jgi:hypothetical protein